MTKFHLALELATICRNDRSDGLVLFFFFVKMTACYCMCLIKVAVRILAKSYLYFCQHLLVVIAGEAQRLICSFSCSISKIPNSVVILDFFIVGNDVLDETEGLHLDYQISC